jgi:predicted RNA-binding protein YlxR (DUF448 family)
MATSIHQTAVSIDGSSNTPSQVSRRFRHHSSGTLPFCCPSCGTAIAVTLNVSAQQRAAYVNRANSCAPRAIQQGAVKRQLPVNQAMDPEISAKRLRPIPEVANEALSSDRLRPASVVLAEQNLHRPRPASVVLAEKNRVCN